MSRSTQPDASVSFSRLRPHATATLSNAHTQAATKAEAEKAKRYGKDILLLVYETCGRLGVRSVDTLRKLAALAAATPATGAWHQK